MEMQARRSFTLRFEHAETHDLLSLVSDRLGVSMNQLAEQMITAELEVVSAGLQADLMHTLGMLARTEATPRPRRMPSPAPR